MACGKAIEAAINKSYFGNSLDTDKVIQELLPRFGMKQLNFVLVNMVRNLNWDNRIYPQNKEWAETISASIDEKRSQKFIAFSVQPGLLNLFADSVRKFEPERKQEQVKNKPSILERLQQSQEAKRPAKAMSAKKRKESEL